MRMLKIGDYGISERSTRSLKESLRELHKIGEQYLSNVYDSKKLTTDMDGVLIYDDNAITASRIIAGPEAQQMYSEYSDMNIKAVSQGQTSYCWYAPTLFVGQLLKGLPIEINRIIGRNMRLIPNADEFIDKLSVDLDYSVVVFTAGHQEAAEEVSRRLNIMMTIGTRLGISNGLYNGAVTRFIGGKHKAAAVKQILISKDAEYNGTHLGDSWSDVETLEMIPNSIAFNPGCLPAFKNAKISVAGISLLSILPLLDNEGKCDSRFGEYNLPEVVAVIEGNPQEGHLEKLLKEIKTIKKIRIGSILDETVMHESEVEKSIRRELEESGIDFKTRLQEFMPPEDFDAVAKNAYKQLFPD